MKRLSIIVVLAFAFVLLSGGIAYANFGPHGGYEQDTDACAGCHRAHTSFSPITWTDSYSNTHSALLISSATTMEQFCYACHGDGAPGASTNVETGIFDAGPSSPSPGGIYTTNSTYLDSLNGGGFSLMSTDGATWNPVTSAHKNTDGINIIWGDGMSATDSTVELICTECHDPHGSSNYRLLKDEVNGNAVGGYDSSAPYDAINPNPEPFVVSAEEGYPTGGWLLHEPGAAQVASYLPDYTTPQYGYKYPDGRGQQSMSAWCTGCHERYLVRDDATSTAPNTWVTAPGTYDYGAYEAYSPSAGTTYTVGARARHRHPVNISIAAGIGAARALVMEVITSTVLPLEFDGIGRTSADFRTDSWDGSDYIGCLTCHVAHGTSVQMTGWAESSLVASPSATVTWYPQLISQPVTSGVNPAFTSSLLRADNRGVCERCHNK